MTDAPAMPVERSGRLTVVRREVMEAFNYLFEASDTRCSPDDDALEIAAPSTPRGRHLQ